MTDLPLQNYENIDERLKDFLLTALYEKYATLDELKTAELLKAEYPSDYALLAEQIKLYEKLQRKLPLFAERGCLVTARSLEQSSSAPLASFKANMFKGDRMLDLCGGLGADDIAFASNFKNVTSLDTDPALNALVRFNLKRLDVANVERIDVSAETFLEQNKDWFDLVYADADRRAGSKQKTYTLEDASPDITRLADRIFNHTDTLLLKLSPVVDLVYIMRTFPGWQHIWVVSLHHEVKEVLVCIDKRPEFTGLVSAVNLSAEGFVQHWFDAGQGEVMLSYTPEGTYFYEPANALIKSGLTRQYAKFHELQMVSKESLYMLGEEEVEDYFGRCFKVQASFAFSKQALKQYLQSNGITKANISARNFPATVEELKKTFKIEDGGDDYFFFSKDAKQHKWVWHCRRN